MKIRRLPLNCGLFCDKRPKYQNEKQNENEEYLILVLIFALLIQNVAALAVELQEDEQHHGKGHHRGTSVAEEW